MNGLDGEFHKQQRQPITVFYVSLLFYDGKSHKSWDWKPYHDFTEKCSYTVVTVVVKRRISSFGTVSDRGDLIYVGMHMCLCVFCRSNSWN